MFKTILHQLLIISSFIRKLPIQKKVLLAVIFIGLGWFTYTRIVTNTKKTTEYQTATAEKGTLITSISASGNVYAASSASITSSATGIVKDVYVSKGEKVVKGQKIASLTLDTNSQQKQAAAWASYVSAQNNLNISKSKMNSLQAALFTANQKFVNGTGTKDPIPDDPSYIIERANWLQAEADYNNQQGAISAAQASLTSAWLSYNQVSATITAPISGVISNLMLSPGMALSSSSSSSSDTSNISSTYGSISLQGVKPQATVNVSEIDIPKVQTEQKVTLTLDAFPDKTFTGKVTSINTSGSVSSGVISYPVTITFDTDVENMYSNMTVNATIITNVKDNAILIPSGAIVTGTDTQTVQVQKNGQITSVTVEIGGSNDTQTEILTGIQEGDTIVTSATSSISQTQTTTTSPFSGFGGFSGGVRGR
jgi:macrolide-specific efflux system membrane fusion protein